MKFIHIVGIIILMGGTKCSVDTTDVKITNEQRALLRKLQNFEEPQNETNPLTWNEILADVLVNRIKLFSFHKVNESEAIKEDSAPSKSKKILVSCFSQALLIYKSCVYDKWTKKYYEEPDFEIHEPTEETNIINTTELHVNDDVEIIEPKYHGKQIEPEKDNDGEIIKAECPEGSVKDDKGNCINTQSRLLISVPRQCPAGYRADRLGNCRLVFF